MSQTERVDAVMAELEQAHSKSSSSLRSVSLLLGSAALFVALGAWFWSIELVLYLLPILLFHELGHYVAMRYFRYRNLKMFFLPLLGAAVSGQHFNIPGWKKVLVSLAGPIPGILLAIPMVVIAVQTQNELWRNATLMIVLVNVFNLLPLLPLDGGWVAHALYFCRQPWLDVLFRLTAAIGMVSIGITWQLYFFMGFGALMMMAVPVAIKNSSIAKKVKSEGLETVSDDSETIPRATVERIVAHLPTEGPNSLPKPLAQQTKQIFNAITARPPGAVATFLLTLLYLAGWVISFGVLVVVLKWPEWQQNWTTAPVVRVSSDTGMAVWRPDAQPVDDHMHRYLMLGICQDVNAVQSCVAQLKQYADCPFALATAGNFVLVSLDLDQAETASGAAMIAAFKSSVKSHHWFNTHSVFHFRIDCTVADSQLAERIAHQANEMLMFGNDLGLIEPWSPEYQVSPSQFHRRETRRILDAPFDAASDPVLSKLSELLDDASLESNRDENDEIAGENMKEQVRQKMEQYDRVYEERYEAAVDQLRADQSGNVDASVLEHWDRRPGRFQDKRLNAQANTMEEKPWRSKLAELLGRIPGTNPIGITPKDHDDGRLGRSHLRGNGEPFKYMLTAGIVSSDGRQVQFQFAHFRNAITGLPAVLEWLRANGCEDLQFQILKNLDLNSLP